MSEVPWGNPWHGRFHADGLHLGSGAVRPLVAPANSPNSLLVRFADIGPSETPPDLAAEGGEWLADAVLYTCEKRYSPAGGPSIGYSSWLWRDALGQVWRLTVLVFNSTSSPAVGAQSTATFQVFARRFGLFGMPVESDTLILQVGRQWINRGPNNRVVIPHLAHSPTGARTAVTLRTGPTVFTAQPAAGDMAARAAIARAPAASGLYEITVTGLAVSGLPVVQLATVIDSDAALIQTNTTTPGLMIGGTQIDIASSGSLYGEAVSPGVERDSGYEDYSVPTIPGRQSTSSTTTRLMCSCYQGETLAPVWHQKQTWSNSLDSGTPGPIGRFDWSYLHPAGVPGSAGATEALRTTAAFEYLATQGLSLGERHSLKIGAAEVASWERETINRTDYTFTMPAVSDPSLPSGAAWFNGRASFLTSSTADVIQVLVNGAVVASGSPLVTHDALRAAWTTAQPLIASNNVFALCPLASGLLYVEQVVAENGATASIDPPTAAGPYGELACPSYNPRTAALSIVIDGINGYV